MFIAVERNPASFNSCGRLDLYKFLKVWIYIIFSQSLDIYNFLKMNRVEYMTQYDDVSWKTKYICLKEPRAEETL